MWLLWVACLAVAHGASILSRSPVTDIIDGVVQRTQTITVQCDAGDYDRSTSFTLTKADGTVANLTVTCGAVQYLFDTTALGVMYTDKIMTTRRLCTYWQVPKNTSIADVLASAPDNGGGGGGARRRLLSWGSFVRGLERAACTNPVVAFANEGCGGGGDGVSQEDFDKLKTAVDTLNSAAKSRYDELDNLAKAQTDWNHNLLNVTQQSAAIQRDLASAMNVTNSRLDAGQLAANITSQSVAALLIANRTLTAAISANYANLTAQINNVNSAIGNTLVTEFNKSYTIMYQLQTNLTGAIHQLRDLTGTAFNDAYLRERIVTRAVRDISTAVLKLNQRFEDTRGFTRLLLDAISALPSGYTPFLLNAGTLPVTNDASWVMAMETTRFLYVVSTTAFQKTISYLCNARYLLNNFKGWYTWKDFIETMGPDGCDPAAPSGPTVCSCYVSVASRDCVAAIGAANMASFQNNLTLDAATCSNDISAETTTYLYSGQSVLTLLSSLCSDIGSKNVTLGAVLRSKRMTYLNAAESCAISFTNLDAPLSGSGLPFVILAQWELSARGFLPNIPVLMDYFDGVGPQGATFKDMPFQRLAGTPGRCVEAAFNSYGTNTEYVYRIDPVDLSVSATATVTGAESVSGASPLVGVSLLSLLPEGGTAVVGDPRSNVTVYDIPNTMIGLTGGRPGTVNYHMQPYSGNMTQSAWESYWNMAFDHYAEGPPASLFQTSVNASTGRCLFPGRATNLSSYYAGVGSWCDLRSAYSVRSVAGQPGRMALVPRSGGAYTVSFTVSEGDITQSLLSVCPTVVLETTGSGVLIILQNSRSAAVRVTIRVNYGQGSGNCEATYSSLLVPAGSSYTQFVGRCNSGSIGQTASILRVLGNGTLAACAGLSALNITTSSTTYTSTFGNAAVSYVDLATASQASQVSLAMMDIFTQMQNLIQDTLYTQANVFQQIGLPTNLSWYNSALERLSNFSVALNTTLRVVAPVSANTSGNDAIINAYQSQLNSAFTAQDISRADFITRMSNVTTRIDGLDAGVSSLANLTDRFNRAIQSALAAELTFTNALTNYTLANLAVIQDIKDNHRSGGLFGNLFTAYTDLLREVLSDGEAVGGWFGDLVKDVVDEGKGFLGKLASGIGDILLIVVIAVVVVGGVVGAVVLYRMVKRVDGMSAGSIQSLSDADVAALRKRMFPGGASGLSEMFGSAPMPPSVAVASTVLGGSTAGRFSVGLVGRQTMDSNDEETARLLEQRERSKVPPPPRWWTRWYRWMMRQ